MTTNIGPGWTRTSNQGIMPTTSACAAKRALVRGLDCAFTMSGFRDSLLGASVSSLYTFPQTGLGSALART
jgi:hypothetical protein